MYAVGLRLTVAESLKKVNRFGQVVCLLAALNPPLTVATTLDSSEDGVDQDRLQRQRATVSEEIHAVCCAKPGLPLHTMEPGWKDAQSFHLDHLSS